MRPTEVILGDEFALFRDPFNGEPFDNPTRTSWDYALINALGVIEDYTMENGILAWENESDSVDVLAVQKIDKFEAAKESYNKRNKKEVAGGYLVPRVQLKPFAKEWPTMREWMEKQRG